MTDQPERRKEQRRASVPRTTVVMYGFVFISIVCVALAATAVVLFGKQVDKNRTLSEKLKMQDISLQAQIAANRKLALQGEEAHVGICAFRTDLRDRIASDAKTLKTSKKIVRDHPEGFLGLSPEVLRASIVARETSLRNAKRTAKSLNSVNCKE